jgi:hypothetical protein
LPKPCRRQKKLMTNSGICLRPWGRDGAARPVFAGRTYLARRFALN